ncbi:sensor histidine kinase [Chitinophaga silvatica]|uniref:histidine kinase n=2 Tax=Chitinophaga silvatica TaxID=2282649 RepID=A0A3E1Y6X2_9BACT|nr:sensor histidine kinase [Chitinophaga silvatica]
MEKSIHQRERSFYKLANDTTLTSELLNRNYDQTTLDKLTDLEYSLFAYDSSNAGIWLTFWSTNQVQPEELEATFSDSSRFMKLNNGYYEVITKRLKAPARHHQYLVGVIPVRLEYSIKNNYLVSHFYDKEELGEEYSILRDMPSLRLPEHIILPVNNSDGETLFYLDYNSNMKIRSPNSLSVLLMVLGCICVLIFINLFATLLAKTTNPLYGFLFLFTIVLTLRVTSYYYPFPFNLRALNIFDPRIYAKDEIFYSLGDLLVNVLLTFWMILFFREHVKTINPPVIRNRWIQSLVIIIASLILYIVEQFLAELIQSLVIDSKISFDVTNPFSLTEYSIVGFVVLGFISFSFLFFSQIINYLLNELTNFQYKTKYIWLGAVGLIWLLFRIHHPELYFFISMVIWLLLYIVLLDFLADRFESSTATIPFLFWLFLLTITTSAVLVHYNNHKELSVRQKLAEDLSRKKDPYLEMLLNDVGKKIEQDEAIQYFFQDSQRRERRKSVFDNQLLQKYFQGYLSRFKVNIYVYDENGSSLFPNSDTVSLMTFNRLMFFESQATPASGAGNDLYYYERSFNDYSYIVKKEFHNTNNEVSGWLVYTLTPKVVNNGRLYPELLVEGDLTDPGRDNAGNYAYAVYDKNILVSNNSGYPFPIRLYAHDLPVSDLSVRSVNGYSEMIYKASPDKVVIVVKENRMFVEFITLFAYMFCLFLLIVAVYKVFDLLIKARMRLSNLRSLIDVSIRRKVHGTIIFVVVFSFVILGITTVKFFTYRSQTQNRERLSKTMREVGVDIEKVFETQRDLDQVGDIYDSELMKKLNTSLADIADERALDINVYDRDGNLQLTTQPMMTGKGLISTKMDPRAYYHLSRLDQVQYIHTEYIGEMPYLSGYTPIRNHDTHEVVAYLNVPYFATQTELNQQISNFLVALINFNAFIFLIAGMLALLITNSITRSFSLVAEKLRHVNLGQRNDEIEWDKDDEIGALVKEYNKMVRKLEVSAVRLAKSEREGAWREMARQVAHEIKNPLTPMKLSIQYLQRAIANDSPNVKELSRNVANTLVEQIDHLSNIASDFSTFARIGEANNERVLLNEVIHSLTSLYQGQENCEIEYIQPHHDFYVYADKTQMNRLFTNLLQNASQAIPENKHGHIVVRLQQTADNHVLVSVSDNGEGISTEIQSRIFVPNFTTKSSGTGLGLAMCKNIAEQARGEIWFETKLNEGTTFYVKLPLAE